MRLLLAATVILACPAAQAGPLALYDTSRDVTALAPLSPAPPCGGPAAVCSAAPIPPQHPTLPFEFGGSLSGAVGGVSHVGAVSGEAVSGWVRSKDVPLELYFGFERTQPIGR